MKYSKNGYKRNSEDVNNPYNVIPSGNITMKGVDFPVMGTDDYGNQKLMMPGGEYIFPGNNVFEVPLQNLPRHFQQGGSLPKAQNGVDYSITKQGYRPMDDQFFDSYQDRNYKCSETDGCILRPTRSIGYNTGDNSLFASYNPEIEVPLFGADRIRGGGTVLAGGLEGRGNLNYDFNTNKPSLLTELTATGRLGYNKYGRRREGQGLVNPFTNKRMDEFDPKTEFGIQAGYDVLNNKMKDVGLYGRYGILDANLGYNLNNKQVQAGIGLRFQDGGSLPKAQAGINEFEINNFGHIETEKGYDEDALFEFAKDKYKKVNTASQKSDLVTKLNSPAFRQRYKKNIFNITGETLSEEELTNRINQQSDFTEAGPDFHVKMPYVTNSPNKGYKRSHTPYISPFSGYNADGEKVGLGQGKLEWRNNKGLYQQKNNNDTEGNLFGSTYFSDVTNPDFPELAKYPYIPMLMDHRDPYIMGDNQVVPFDDANSTIVHEYAHSYNTDDSPLFNPAGEDFASVDENKYDESGNLISKGNFSMLPGDKYKGWLSNLFGEDYFDEDKNKHGTWAMHPWEISSIKSETEAQLKNNNIWDNTKGEFGEGNLNNMLKLNSRLDLGGPERDHLNRMGYSSLERMNYDNKRTIKNQDDVNWSIDNNPNDYILDNIINAEDNASMDMDAFNTIFNNSQSNLKDKQKYSDYNSLLEDYTNGNKRKKKKATEIINTINKDVKNQINQGYNTENENYQIEYNKKKGEVLPKLEKYFNEIAMENGDQPTMAKFGGSLPKAQEGFIGPQLPTNESKGLQSRHNSREKNKVIQGVNQGLAFNEEWINSKMANNMLLNSTGSQEHADFITNARAYQLENSGRVKVHDTQPEGKTSGGNSHSNNGNINVFPYGYNVTEMGSHEGSHSSDRPLSKDDAYALSSWGDILLDIPLKSINGWANFLDGGNAIDPSNYSYPQQYTSKRLIPDSDVNMMNDFRTNNNLEDNEYDLIVKKQQEALDQLYQKDELTDVEEEEIDMLEESIASKTDWADYVGRDTETRARLMAIRNGANNLGVYDPFNDKVSPDIMEQLLNTEFEPNDKGFDPLQQLKDIYSDDEIRIMLNEVASKKQNGTQQGNQYGISDEDMGNPLLSKYGGSLPQFQKKGENSYQVEVIQYPLGYDGGQGGMPPGHIESRYLGDLSGTDYEGQKGYVNRWVDKGNKPVSYNAETDYQDGVRTSILNLNKKEFDHYMKTAQTFTSGDKTDLPEFMGKDYRGNPLNVPTAWGGDDTDYDLVNSNCADGVCDALGLDGNYSTLGVTTPQQVMDAIKKDKRTQSSTGNKNYGETVLQGVLNPLDMITESAEESAEFYIDLAKGVQNDIVKNSSDFTGGLINLDQTPSEAWKNTKEWWGFKEGGERWENTNQIEEYQAYFKNPKLIDKSWGKDSTTALKIKEAVDNNIFYNELPDYLKGVDTWKSTSSSMDVDKELKILEKAQDGTETNVSFDDLEKGIRHVESLNGTLMKNKQSSASGYYGDLFDNLDYDGTRAEFIADTTYQKNHFIKRYNGEVTDVPGLESNGQDIYNEYKDQVDFTYTPTQIAALSNMLGRQGTRKYFGDVLRDEKTLEEVFPHLYGDERQLGKDGKPLENKTPDEYINKFTDAISKKRGGEFTNKIKRLKEQLAKYNKGGLISPLAEQELVKLKMIKPKMQNGAEVKKPYVIKRGDNLSTIARDNNMSLSEILSLNPRYKNDPSKIGVNQVLQLSDAPVENSDTPDLYYTVKKGDSLSKIASKYGVRYQDIQSINGINNPSLIKPGKKLRLPDNVDRSRKHVQEQIKRAESVYTPSISEVNVDQNVNINVPWAKRVKVDGKWVTQGKRNTKTEINKMEQADRIVEGMKEIHPKSFETNTYKVKSGDNLSTIAANNNMTITELEKANNIDRNNDIQVGQDIKINKPTGKPYIVVDEKLGRMHLYYPGQDKPAKSYPILTGANEGDAQTVTKIGIFKDGVKIDQDELNQAMKDNNISSVDELMEVEGYTSKTDWDAGNKQTGAGIYTIGMINEDSGYYDDSGNNNPTPSFVLNNSNGAEVPMVIHTAPSKNDGRVENLNDNNASNNRVTNGCINGKCEDLTELYNTPGVGKGTMIYVLPEDAGNNFVFENGEINYYTSRENQTDALTYIDERGEEQKGHGIANKTTTNYKPINITFDKNYYQTNSKRYDGTAAGEEEEFVNNTQPFLNSIVDNKKLLMDKLGMDGDMYNDLSMIAFGIYGYESGMGDEGSAGENLLKAGLKFTGVQDTSPDVKSKYNTYGVDGAGNSVGWTQIRWNQLDDTEKAALKKIDITSNDQLMDPANAAIATTAILYKRYQNQISRADKNSEGFDIFTELPKKWNKGKGYTDVVNTYMDYIDLTETDVDDVDNKLIVKGEYKDDNIESNKRMSNTPIEEKILNMGETIAHEYNQSDYIKPSVDAVVEGVEGVGNWIGETADDVSEWWDEVDLNPFYKSGGEFGIDNQVQFYNDYINGLYKNTKQEKKSKKMYDKLNRLYYNDSKQNNIHQLDVMESIKRQG